MFYRSPLDSLLYLPALSSCVFRFPDFGPVIQRKKEQKKKTLFVRPPTPPFVITKEQTHIKHTQGAEAVIAVSAVLLWVAGDDNISHRSIYIIFLIMSCLNHGQLEASIFQKIDIFAYNKHCITLIILSSFSCGMPYVKIWAIAKYSTTTLIY